MSQRGYTLEDTGMDLNVAKKDRNKGRSYALTPNKREENIKRVKKLAEKLLRNDDNSNNLNK